MTNEEYVTNLIKQMKCSKHPIMHGEDNSLKGETALIGFLTEHKKGITSGELSEKMNVSTPRIAAALNNLEYKGLISRKIDNVDKRKVIVTLTKKGWEYSNKIENKIKNNLLMIVSELGQENFTKYIETTKKIKQIIERNDNNV